MTTVDDADLAAFTASHPELYHVAERGAWAGIAWHGLLSTSALLTLFEVTGEARAEIETRRRPEFLTLTHPRHGRAVLRDQKPLGDATLSRCLEDGLAPADWYKLLNGRVFFWPTRRRLFRLLEARGNAGREHDVLTIDTGSLLAAHGDRITLSPINSGASSRFPRPRGGSTFLPIADYPYRERRKRGLEPVVELAVSDGIREIAQHVIRVEEMRGRQVLRRIWEPREPPRAVAPPLRGG
ncbi:MAG TPA: hypothetical protein VGD08_00680 [Stellaceae bacterium]